MIFGRTSGCKVTGRGRNKSGWDQVFSCWECEREKCIMLVKVFEEEYELSIRATRGKRGEIELRLRGEDE